MKLNKIFIILAVIVFGLCACSSDDDNGVTGLNGTVNFSVTLSENRTADVNTQVNDDSFTQENAVFPYTRIVENVNTSNTFLQLTFVDQTVVASDNGGGDNSFSYTVNLIIRLNNQVVAEQEFMVDENSSGNPSINVTL